MLKIILRVLIVLLAAGIVSAVLIFAVNNTATFTGRPQFPSGGEQFNQGGNLAPGGPRGGDGEGHSREAGSIDGLGGVFSKLFLVTLIIGGVVLIRKVFETAYRNRQSKTISLS